MGVERGQMLSHYRLVEKIGEGGMGVVWKSEDTILDRTVAIKVLPADLALDEERRRMFLGEARLAASVGHAHIVQVHELGREADLDFIVMEFVEGQPLSRLLRGKPLPPDKVAVWGVQVAEGLARAHRNGLIHRDLKPANILVTPDGEVKIVDFGLATLFSREELTATYTRTLTEAGPPETPREIAGTLPYMSPEQVRGEKLDARSDIFSFGTVLYEMTTGQRPFSASTASGVAQEILKSQPRPVRELVPKVPFDLHRIVDKALARRPEDRYQHVDDVAVDLKRLRKELESVSSPAHSVLQPVAQHHRWRRPLLGAAAVIVVGGALLVLRPGQQAPIPSGPTHQRTEIAVLPFQNLSSEGPQAYFAGGLHDELLTQLAKVAALKVISRTSVMGYQGTTKPLKVIATELGVGSVVDGSVQVVDDRLRVNVQLIDAATDEHLWAEHYDRTLDDAFAIQSEVAQQIVSAVGAALSDTEQGRLAAAPTANAEAYRLYLQGSEYLTRPGFHHEDIETARQLLERALALDSNFVLAHATLSRVHGLIYWFQYDPSTARLARTQEEAEAALRLAPDLPEAHAAMGWAQFCHRAFRPAVNEFAIALKGLPNDAVVWRLMAIAQRRLGNWDECVAAVERAAQLNPRDADLFYTVAGHTYRFLHRYLDAVHAYELSLSLAPDVQDPAIDIGWTYFYWQGQLDSLRAILDRFPQGAELVWRSVATERADLLLFERSADSLLMMTEMARPNLYGSERRFVSSALYAAWAHQLRGDQAAARTAFDSARVHLESRLSEFPDDWGAHYAHGMALAGLGRRGEALGEARWLQQSVIYREDPWEGPNLAESRALILAQIGETESALDEIARLLAGPPLNVHELQLYPLWDPLRENPRLKALLAKYAGG